MLNDLMNIKIYIMIKFGIVIWITVILGSCGDNNKELKTEKDEPKDSTTIVKKDSITYSKDDLKKIKWIEGKWRGMYNGKPFYEIYRMVNHSVLEIITYEWNGKDSSKSDKSFVSWKNGAYYLGHANNYKVTEISDTHIKMLPNYMASNDVLWKYVNENRWDAILKGKENTNEYHMERFDPFGK
jgi:hypothetical protein